MCNPDPFQAESEATPSILLDLSSVNASSTLARYTYQLLSTDCLASSPPEIALILF